MTTVSWSTLPSELLHSISKILFIEDYARFRSVCTSWRSAAAASTLPGQPPWLMLPPRLPDHGDEDQMFNPGEDDDEEDGILDPEGDDDEEDGILDPGDDDDEDDWILDPEDEDPSPDPGDEDQILDPQDEGGRLFLSLPGNNLHRLSLPDTRRRICHAAGHGWLLVVGRTSQISEMFLLHAFTGARIPLPPRSTIPDPAAIHSHRRFLDRALLSSNPATPAANWVLVVCVNVSYKLAFCRPGDQEWTMVANMLRTPHPISFFHGSLYASNLGVPMEVSCIDLTVSPARITPASSVPDIYHRCYLVESAGELLLVGGTNATMWVLFEKNFDPMKDVFDVYKLEMTGDSPSWSMVQDIGAWSLFLSYETALSVSASDFPLWCRPNCIYYPSFSSSLGHPEYHDICVFNIADRSISRVPRQRDDSLMWAKAAWILPSLC